VSWIKIWSILNIWVYLIINLNNEDALRRQKNLEEVKKITIKEDLTLPSDLKVIKLIIKYYNELF